MAGFVQLARPCVVGVLLASMVLGTGCSAFQPRTQAVTINASVPDAQININGRAVGSTPLAIQLERNRNHAIVARSGAMTGTASIDRQISTTGILDIIGTFFFIVPVIGVFTPGFWDLNAKDVTVVLH